MVDAYGHDINSLLRIVVSLYFVRILSSFVRNKTSYYNE